LVYAKLTPEHATHGQTAALVTFPHQYYTSFAMQQALKRDPQLRNWTGFARLRFDIVNLSPRDEQLDLKIGASGRKEFVKRLTLPAAVPQAVDIPLEEVA